MKPLPRPVRLSPSDVTRLGSAGLRARPLRAFLSALGIAIGIGAMLAVVGISASSRAELNRTLDQLGTNLLTVTPGSNVAGGMAGTAAPLPAVSAKMIRRIGPVRSAVAAGTINTYVYRNDHVPSSETSSVAVVAVEGDLPRTVAATLRSGAWLTPATARYPAVVLGSRAADRLDVHASGVRLWMRGQWFAVVGVLEPVTLAPALDSAVLVGWPAAVSYLDFAGRPTVIYLRATDSQVLAVRAVLAQTANPQNPNEVAISRPSDALAARQATDAALTGLLLGLGAVALLVGGVGVANTMVISVLERRAEIGLRRSLGATRGHIRIQFLAESLLLSMLGGAGGILLGVAVTSGYALTQGWATVVPVWATTGGLAATLGIGMLAGLYPAVRASRLPPAEALAAG